ncbi:MAG: methyltransferase domain-containing protein, partial [Myxococcales bacterium]|nr:methyltransferase domain-containing protein [Myxococcales bacterium]
MTTPELASGKRGWFEIIFDDDYLRTVRPLSKVGVELQCDFIEEQFGLSPGASILDVGCGSGQHAVELARRGYSVTALDLSSHMLRHAKMNAEEAGVNVTFVHGDMRAMSYDAKFDALLSWNTSFGYFDDDVNRRTMELFHNALKPHGVLLLELANRDFVLQGQPNLIWFEGDGCVCIEETSFNSITSRLLVKRTVIRDDGHQYEHFYSVRLYALHEIGQLMHNRGFRVVRVSGREATPGVFFGADSSRMIVLAERRLPSKSQPRMPRDSGRPTRNDLPPIPTKRSLAPATDTAQTVPEIEADARPDLELDDAGTDPGGEPGPNGDAS